MMQGQVIELKLKSPNRVSVQALESGVPTGIRTPSWGFSQPSENIDKFRKFFRKCDAALLGRDHGFSRVFRPRDAQVMQRSVTNVLLIGVIMRASSAPLCRGCGNIICSCPRPDEAARAIRALERAGIRCTVVRYV